eukprot:CAMPEP_0206390084 /NCGR_PEP_ID=MMETSP0294-20121207/18374_1 /ASSEMBLY_ACC=CAM_ASM_000327 /TAXON_ID=39354 /ORGANISM="Heterosigma akashiwo, Strain CCMP2393" /LENGTH=105 /DNA_ID=CAMNT_0053842347 /DNA_START=632 /DNA_END=945 /DNA_ORIENTATION=+
MKGRRQPRCCRRCAVAARSIQGGGEGGFHSPGPGGGAVPLGRQGAGPRRLAVLGGALTNADVYVAVTVASLRPSPPPSPSIAGAAPLPPKPFWAAVERVAEFHEL